MQPQKTISQDIKTLADWTYEQFKPTDPIEVQNILDTPYKFKYCTGETIETPDQVSRKVVGREYEEHTFEPGETMVLMGAAAYIFVSGVAQAYVLQTKGQDAVGNLQHLVDAAHLCIIGRVNYAKHSEPEKKAPTFGNHNPNGIADESGKLPEQGNGEQVTNTGQDEPGDAFANLGSSTEFVIGDDHYDTTANGRGRKNKQFITNEEFAAAQAQYASTNN